LHQNGFGWAGKNNMAQVSPLPQIIYNGFPSQNRPKKDLTHVTISWAGKLLPLYRAKNALSQCWQPIGKCAMRKSSPPTVNMLLQSYNKSIYWKSILRIPHKELDVKILYFIFNHLSAMYLQITYYWYVAVLEYVQSTNTKCSRPHL